MERRQFIRALCSGVAAWPLAAYAQQVSNPRRIGVLGADPTVWSSWTVAFVTRLRELGWTTGETVDVDYRWAGGSSKRTKPGDIPVEQPTKFDFAINVNTAIALGLAMPPKLLATADEVIK